MNNKICFHAYLFLIICMLGACNQEKDKEEAIYNEVIALHDEVMTEMNTTARLKNELKEQLDNPSAGISTEEINSLMKALAEANENMMQWMRNFNQDLEGKSHQEKMDFYRQEKAKMQEIKKQFENAIEEAEELLNEGNNK